MGDERLVPRRAADRRPGGARRERLHRAGGPPGPARRSGHLLSRRLPEPRGAQGAERAGDGSVPDAPAGRRTVTFAFSGDEVGQGWGINAEWGGMKMYEVMRRSNPDFFIHSGDQIYADGPLKAEVTLDDGTI